MTRAARSALQSGMKRRIGRSSRLKILQGARGGKGRGLKNVGGALRAATNVDLQEAGTPNHKLLITGRRPPPILHVWHYAMAHGLRRRGSQEYDL